MTGVMGALVAGLLGSVHCVGMCGGFAAAAGEHDAGGAVAWHLGRGAAYAALGALAGAIGGVALDSRAAAAATVAALALLAWFALRLGGALPERGGAGSSRPLRAVTSLAARLARARGVPARAAFGATVALLPCGLLWSALAMAGASGGAAAGALTMAAFWSGSVPALSVASKAVRALAGRSLAWRRGLAALVFVAGAYAVLMRAPRMDATADAPPPCHAGMGAEADH
jgi:sulfite exporter TauE/SafE